MAEKIGRAGSGAIGPGAEHRDQIADLRLGQMRLVGKPVERGAQAADDIGLF